MHLVHVTLIPTPVDPSTWTRHEVPDLLAFLASRWETFPEQARIYEKAIAQECDVTPGDVEGIERLAKLPGPFYVVEYPAGPAAIIVGALVVAVAAVALMPKVPEVPTVAQRNQSSNSPNNDLAERTNRPRINGRIPDIYGTVRSTPDLVAQPYKIFENNNEVEYSYMAIGRGEYEVEDIRDGDTLCQNIPGTTVRVFAPYTSPNSGDAPQLVVGTPRDVPVLRTSRSNSVNGQVLRPPNAVTFTGLGNVRFLQPNVVELIPGALADFTKSFVPGDVVTITGAQVTVGGTFNGTIPCIATTANLSFTYGRIGFSPRRYPMEFWNTAYGSARGALLFKLQGAPQEFFKAGETITITQVGTATSKRSGPVNLSGTYTIDDVMVMHHTGRVFAPTSPKINEGGAAEIQRQKNAQVPLYLVVKLVNPQAVNADWAKVTQGSGTTWPSLDEAVSFNMEMDYGGTAVEFSVDLDGVYPVVSVTKSVLVLDNPGAVAPDWNNAGFLSVGQTPYLSVTIASAEGSRWVGPYVLADEELGQLFANFVAQAGLYKDNGEHQYAVNVQVELEITPVNRADQPVGDPELFTVTLVGSSILKESVATTLTAHLSSFVGRARVRARRVTKHDNTFEGTVIDEVRWRDLYSVAYVDAFDFGNVTTVQSIVYATASALAVKERKLNMRVTRKLPQRVGETKEFTDEAPVATLSAADIFIAVCRDHYIGNRRTQELDVDNIYNTVREVEEYFGHAHAAQFCYTFDQDNISFEEIASAVANALHCTAYRRGNVIRLAFEQQTEDSTLLFNHRNKIPGTEVRSVSFGYADDNDGIEFAYVDPEDDSVINVFLPEKHAAINPKKIESIGVRNHLQAYFLAWRAWNKIRFQNVSIEFDATQEAELLVRGERILVADGTRAGSQEGEIVAVDGLELTTSKVLEWGEGAEHTVFLQRPDGAVEAIDCARGEDATKIILATAPAVPLVVDPESYARATFLLVRAEDELVTRAFIMQERTPQGRMVSTVRAMNYSDAYYARDKDYVEGRIDEAALGSSGGFTMGAGVPYGEAERAARYGHSTIYALEMEADEMRLGAEPTDSATWALTEDMLHYGALPLSGSMRSTLNELVTEEMVEFGTLPTAGTLTFPVPTYNDAPDDMVELGTVPMAGAFTWQVPTYNLAAPEMLQVGALPTGGSLS